MPVVLHRRIYLLTPKEIRLKWSQKVMEGPANPCMLWGLRQTQLRFCVHTTWRQRVAQQNATLEVMLGRATPLTQEANATPCAGAFIALATSAQSALLILLWDPSGSCPPPHHHTHPSTHPLGAAPPPPSPTHLGLCPAHPGCLPSVPLRMHP